jgi:hypothetical protein
MWKEVGEQWRRLPHTKSGAVNVFVVVGRFPTWGLAPNGEHRSANGG